MLKFKTNLKCNGCVQTIRPYLESMKDIKTWEVDLKSPDRLLTVEGDIDEEKIIRAVRAAGYRAKKV